MRQYNVYTEEQNREHSSLVIRTLVDTNTHRWPTGWLSLTPWRPLLPWVYTATKHSVPDWVEASFVFLTSGRSGLSIRVKNYKWRLNPVWHRMFYSCSHMATVGVEGLSLWTFDNLQVTSPAVAGSSRSRVLRQNIEWSLVKASLFLIEGHDL